ncbi:MAG: hypothetical protein AAF411_24090 [Myxococcota bacterium]
MNALRTCAWASVLWMVVAGCGRETTSTEQREGLAQALESRGRIVALDVDYEARGTEMLQPSAAVREALEGESGEALRNALAELDARGVVVSTGLASEGGLVARLARGEHVQTMRGALLHPDAMLYLNSLHGSLGRDAELAGPIARRLLEGAPRPPLSSFPASYRREGSVEVMVLLRDRGRRRLWRSARGSSVASALITAASFARQRWREREQALGGPLEERLADLDVEVSLLEEDGTLASVAEPFIERLFDDVHGVAYESSNAWRYLLPEATLTKGEGSAVEAYRQLFREDGRPEDGFDSVRLYRLVVTPLGADRGGADGLRGADAVDGAALGTSAGSDE